MNVTKEIKQKILNTLNKFRVISNENNCYGWSGKKQENRPPHVFINNESIGAHRATWMAYFGKIPDSTYVHHTCENKSCTNPAHLFLSKDRGTRKDPETRKNGRIGRERLAVDLPRNLVTQIRVMAEKYNVTITKFLLTRLTEVIEYERKLEKK